MIKNMVKVFALAAALSSPALAADCGEPPLDIPQVPSGETATPEQMRQAREAVISYSDKVDTWLTCMDNRSTRLAQYMTREQRARLTEDLNQVHLDRQSLQRTLNVEIRAYRNARRNS